MLNPADKRRERQGGRSLNLFLSLVALTLLLLVLDELGVLVPVKGQALRLLTPAQRGLTRVRESVGSVWANVGGADELRQENEALRQQLAQKDDEILRLRTLEVENDRLLQSLGMKQSSGWSTVAASVLATADADRKAVFIDRGQQDGIEIGMVVVGREGGSQLAMVGVVEAVYAQNAEVLLVTDYRSVISAQGLHKGVKTEVYAGEIQGRWQLGEWLLLVNLDRDAPLEKGDPVLTAGMSQRFNTKTPAARIPANVPIGTVEEVKSLGHSKEAKVKPYLNPDRVRNVWVIVGNE
jgi:rod shape-determining protein MreC